MQQKRQQAPGFQTASPDQFKLFGSPRPVKGVYIYDSAEDCIGTLCRNLTEFTNPFSFTAKGLQRDAVFEHFCEAFYPEVNETQFAVVREQLAETLLGIKNLIPQLSQRLTASQLRKLMVDNLVPYIVDFNEPGIPRLKVNSSWPVHVVLSWNQATMPCPLQMVTSDPDHCYGTIDGPMVIGARLAHVSLHVSSEPCVFEVWSEITDDGDDFSHNQALMKWFKIKASPKQRYSFLFCTKLFWPSYLNGRMEAIQRSKQRVKFCSLIVTIVVAYCNPLLIAALAMLLSIRRECLSHSTDPPPSGQLDSSAFPHQRMIGGGSTHSAPFQLATYVNGSAPLAALLADPYGHLTSRGLKKRWGTDPITAMLQANPTFAPFGTGASEHWYGLVDGLCGFFAFGVAMNNIHTGTRGEWMTQLGNDLSSNPPVLSLKHDKDQLAARSFQTLQAYAQARNSSMGSVITPFQHLGVVGRLPGTGNSAEYDWTFLSDLDMPSSPFGYVDLSMNVSATNTDVMAAVSLYNCANLATAETLVIRCEWSHHFTVVTGDAINLFRNGHWTINLAKQRSLTLVESDACRFNCRDLKGAAVPIAAHNFPSWICASAPTVAHPVNATYQLLVATSLTAPPGPSPAVITPAVPAAPPAAPAPPAREWKKLTFARSKSSNTPVVNSVPVIFKNNDMDAIESNPAYKRCYYDSVSASALIYPKGVPESLLRSYGHRNMRGASDFLYARALTKTYALNSPKRIHDVGSKWHKISAWMQEIDAVLGLTIATMLTAYRPRIQLYDRKYWSIHNPAANVTAIPDIFSASNVLAGEPVLANDCIWYPNVLEQLIIACQTSPVGLCYPVYDPTVGVHNYPKGEGKYTVFEQDGVLYVRNEPTDNDLPGGYVHKLIRHSSAVPAVFGFKYGKYNAILYEVESIKFGDMRQVQCQLLPGFPGDEDITPDDFRRVLPPAPQAPVPITLETELLPKIQHRGYRYKQRWMEGGCNAFIYYYHLCLFFLRGDKLHDLLFIHSPHWKQHMDLEVVSVPTSFYQLAEYVLQGNKIELVSKFTHYAAALRLKAQNLFPTNTSAANQTLALNTLRIYIYRYRKDEGAFILDNSYSPPTLSDYFSKKVLRQDRVATVCWCALSSCLITVYSMIGLFDITDSVSLYCAVVLCLCCYYSPFSFRRRFILLLALMPCITIFPSVASSVPSWTFSLLEATTRYIGYFVLTVAPHLPRIEFSPIGGLPQHVQSAQCLARDAYSSFRMVGGGKVESVPVTPQQAAPEQARQPLTQRQIINSNIKLVLEVYLMLIYWVVAHALYQGENPTVIAFINGFGYVMTRLQLASIFLRLLLFLTLVFMPQPPNAIVTRSTALKSVVILALLIAPLSVNSYMVSKLISCNMSDPLCPIARTIIAMTPNLVVERMSNGIINILGGLGSCYYTYLPFVRTVRYCSRDGAYAYSELTAEPFGEHVDNVYYDQLSVFLNKGKGQWFHQQLNGVYKGIFSGKATHSDASSFLIQPVRCDLYQQQYPLCPPHLTGVAKFIGNSCSVIFGLFRDISQSPKPLGLTLQTPDWFNYVSQNPGYADFDLARGYMGASLHQFERVLDYSVEAIEAIAPNSYAAWNNVAGRFFASPLDSARAYMDGFSSGRPSSLNEDWFQMSQLHPSLGHLDLARKYMSQSSDTLQNILTPLSTACEFVLQYSPTSLLLSDWKAIQQLYASQLDAARAYMASTTPDASLEPVYGYMVGGSGPTPQTLLLQKSFLCRHIAREIMTKLEPRELVTIRELKFYKLEGQSCEQSRDGKTRTQQQELHWESGEQLYNYYVDYCTCVDNAITQIDEFSQNYAGHKQTQFTFGTCPLNHIASLLARHLFTNLHPENNMLYRFDCFAAEWIPLLEERMKEAIRDRSYQWCDYIRDLGEKKSKSVASGFLSSVLKCKISRKLTCFTKVGEMQKGYFKKMIFQDDERLEGRPRQIWSPTSTLKAFPGWINRICLYAAKKVIPCIICGYSSIDLSKKTTKDRSRLMMLHKLKDLYVFVFDGSSHDSHQYYRLIRAVDNRFFKILLPFIFEWFCIPSFMHEAIIEAITSDEFYAECFTKQGGFIFLLYSLYILGTTYSGHPTRTTLGNSLRTLCYILFIVYERWGLDVVMQVTFGTCPDLVLYVAGDDVMLYGTDEYITHIALKLKETHAPDVKQHAFGLGQCAREVRREGHDFFDFLSRDGYFDGVQFKLCRKVDRVVCDSAVTKNIPFLVNAKMRRKYYSFARMINYLNGYVTHFAHQGIEIFRFIASRKMMIGEKPGKKASSNHVVADQMRNINFWYDVNQNDTDVEEYRQNELQWSAMQDAKYGRPRGWVDSITHENKSRLQPTWFDPVDSDLLPFQTFMSAPAKS